MLNNSTLEMYGIRYKSIDSYLKWQSISLKHAKY